VRQAEGLPECRGMRLHAALLLLAALSVLPVAACAEAAVAGRPLHHALQLWDSPALAPEGYAAPQSPALSPAPTALHQMLWGRWGAAAGGGVPARSRAPLCQHLGCPKRATFGQRDEDGGGRAFCAEHRSAVTHVDLNRKRCTHAEGCAAFAYYQGRAAAPLAAGDLVAAGDTPATPALPDAATAPVAGGRFARAPAARRPASFGASPAPAAPPSLTMSACVKRMAVHCKKHKVRGATAGRGIRCTATGCTVLATFGPQQALVRTPQRCRRHRLFSDVDTRHAACAASHCRRRAYYGLAGGPARWCLHHKQESCVDVTSKRCEAWVEGPQESDGEEARAEALEGNDAVAQAPVVGNKRRAGYCPTQANFGDVQERRKRFCSRHRRPTDIDLRKTARPAARPSGQRRAPRERGKGDGGAASHVPSPARNQSLGTPPAACEAGASHVTCNATSKGDEGPAPGELGKRRGRGQEEEEGLGTSNSACAHPGAAAASEKLSVSSDKPTDAATAAPLPTPHASSPHSLVGAVPRQLAVRSGMDVPSGMDVAAKAGSILESASLGEDGGACGSGGGDAAGSAGRVVGAGRPAAPAG